MVRAKLGILSAIGLKDPIEDILITLGKHYHWIRLHGNALFLYVILDKAKANLALCQRKIYAIEKAMTV